MATRQGWLGGQAGGRARRQARAYRGGRRFDGGCRAARRGFAAGGCWEGRAAWARAGPPSTWHGPRGGGTADRGRVGQPSKGMSDRATWVEEVSHAAAYRLQEIRSTTTQVAARPGKVSGRMR